jgi:hypothetical protein
MERLATAAMPQEPSKTVTSREPVGDVPQKPTCRILLVEDGLDNQRLIPFAKQGPK